MAVLIIGLLFAGSVFVAVLILSAEIAKSPEQSKAEAERRWENYRRKREEEKRKRQEAQENVPAKGCLQSTLEFALLSIFCMAAIIIAIMILIAATM